MAGAVCGLAILLAGPVAAENVVVIELYTSQGCISCPPADAYLAMMTADPRLMPLSLHVDYWDYIGWTDHLANPRFTERQKAYARAIGSRTIYTPQFIIDGEDRIEGIAPDETMAHLRAHMEAPPPVQLSVARDGTRLTIRAVSDRPLPAPVRVQLVRYLPAETVTIERGENAGKTVTYRNVVTSWDTIGEWSGLEPLDMSAEAPGDSPAVVIVQEPGPAAILAAARAD